MVIRGFLIITALLFVGVSHAQFTHYCLQTADERICDFYRDSLQSSKEVDLWIRNQRKLGYLTAGLDSNANKSDTLIFFLGKGRRFLYLRLKSENFGIEAQELSKQTLWTYQEFMKSAEQHLVFMENNGFPFARFKLNNPEIMDDTLVVDVDFDKGQAIEYDTLTMLGNSTLSRKYLYRYLSISPGSPYDERAIKAIDKKLRNLPLVKVNGPARIYFFRGLARVALDLDDRVTDRFDGVIGFAPNSENSEDNSLLLTGELNIELNNLFRSAKQMKLHWRNYLKRSQLLDVELTWPYLFNTKIGINGALNINKFDTLYVTLNSKLGFRYQQSGNNYLQVYYQYTGSNLITADTNYVRSQKRIPVNNPFRVDNYGITLYQSDLDYLPNPRRGYQFSLDMAIGVKQLLRNIQIEAVRFPAPSGSGTISIYDTLTKNSLRGRFDFSGSFYIPVFKRSTLLNQVRLSGIIANQVLFNELYNFGGFGSLKGFDENSIFASKYALYNLEYRYLLAQNSSVGLFMNVAVIENKLESDLLVYDVPYGFGAIAMIEVRNGILSLAFALGSEQGNAIRLSTSKLHFGIVNYF